jgi:putative SOS response-associated peptidase YedK
MCGRYALTIVGPRLAQLFGIDAVPDLAPRYNVAPTQMAPLVRQGADGRAMFMARWGLIPSWAKDPSIGNRMINARGESVAGKPAFRAAFRRRRCLVPATGFFEWRRSGRSKQPYYIRLRDGEPFALAGLWELWRDPQGGAVESFTIITTDANESLRALHERMPVILSPGDFSRWLDPAVAEPDSLRALLRPYPAEATVAHAVSTRVNSPANDDPDCLEPASVAEAPPR